MAAALANASWSNVDSKSRLGSYLSSRRTFSDASCASYGAIWSGCLPRVRGDVIGRSRFRRTRQDFRTRLADRRATAGNLGSWALGPQQKSSTLRWS